MISRCPRNISSRKIFFSKYHSEKYLKSLHVYVQSDLSIDCLIIIIIIIIVTIITIIQKMWSGILSVNFIWSFIWNILRMNLSSPWSLKNHLPIQSLESYVISKTAAQIKHQRGFRMVDQTQLKKLNQFVDSILTWIRKIQCIDFETNEKRD